ncbi:MAG: flagellar hook-length control protein FliK [Devosia nanyangense]|uniref:Flagellar hook-length control protein FliK n=1 Tax=Devosia nanyangense TaxID=1228055 RepID=A0A933L4S6_9HYPH|nr:flagellar hook-length control protein FliK [Devosia nanyangense]
MSFEASLSSHLTISYSTTPAASGNPAPAAGAVTTATSDSPLGFLAALIDQLLAGGTNPAPAATDTATATAQTVTNPGASALLNFGPKLTAEAKAAAPQGIALLAKLTRQLEVLQGQIDSGESPDPDLLKKLGETADALAALMAVPTPSANPPALDPDTALDPLAALASDAVAMPSLQSAPADGSAPNVPAAPLPPDPVAQLLATLGVTLPVASPPPASPSTPSPDPVASVTSIASAPLPALAALSDKLKTLSATIAATAPDISQKLAALTAGLDAAEADPTLLAQFGAPASDKDGTTLDRIVKALMNAGPSSTAQATPELSTTARLPIPESLGPIEPKTDAAVNPAPIVEAKAASDPPLKISLASEAPELQVADAQPKTEPVVAASVANAAADQSDAALAQTTAAAPGPVTATAPKALPAAYQPVASPINMGQVAFEMVRQVHQGQSRFSIRLDPPELGRIDVKMHVDASGAVNARLTVERSETLDLFQRDQRSLERALTQAGLDAGKTNLEFSLKQNPFAGMTGGDQRQQQSASGGGPRLSYSGRDDTTIVPSVTLYRGTASAGGVNILA